MSIPKHIVALIDAKNEEILRLEAEKADGQKMADAWRRTAADTPL